MNTSKGFCLVAQNNADTDYIKQAYALALSLHKFNSGQKISLITNDVVPEEYKSVFDKIIPIPWGDLAENERWKINNRWKVYHVTPYTETIVMDVDMLVLDCIEHWWDYLKQYNLFFTTNVKTYRQDDITSTAYRTTFTTNNLPNFYSGIYYFKKSKVSEEFFELLEQIMKHWEVFYKQFLKTNTPSHCSVDVSAALAAKILGIEKDVTDNNDIINFIHMKPALQYWEVIPDKWTQMIYNDMDNNGKVHIGPFIQKGVLHYVEDEFLTDNILMRLTK
jgi:hypothetical protein